MSGTTTIDFDGSAFTANESPAGEVNIGLNFGTPLTIHLSNAQGASGQPADAEHIHAITSGSPSFGDALTYAGAVAGWQPSGVIYIKADGTVGLANDWDAGSHKITVQEISTDDVAFVESTPGAPSQNTLILYAKANGNYIDLMALSSTGAEIVLASLLDTAIVAPDPTLALNWIEV